MGKKKSNKVGLFLRPRKIPRLLPSIIKKAATCWRRTFCLETGGKKKG